jgi:hypothetical protein
MADQTQLKPVWNRVLRGLTRPVLPTGKAARPPSKTVAIVVPVSNRKELLPEEEVSLRHLVHYLARYDKYVVAPRGLDLHWLGFTTYEFSPKYFGSMPAYNRLMYLPQLYELFREYEYILIYHLDSLAFRDELLDWCRTGADFIGAPWIPGADLPWVKEPAVGNGGFALMKVETILKVLYQRYREEPLSYWRDIIVRNFSRRMAAMEKAPADSWAGRMGRVLLPVWKQAQMTETEQVLNDIFWGYHARRLMPEFQIPDWRTALGFAFESCPRQCFEMNGRKLPFGCHAWAKFDRAFWEPYLLPKEAPRGQASVPAGEASGGKVTAAENRSSGVFQAPSVVSS